MGGGGVDSSAQKAQINLNRETMDLIERQTELGRRDVIKTADPALQAFVGGQQQALDVFGQAVPEQFRTMQAGNMNAQNQIISGGHQMYNALMGLPIDGTAFQAQGVNPNFGFAQGNQVQAPPNMADLLAFTDAEQNQFDQRIDTMRNTRSEMQNLLDTKIATDRAINSGLASEDPYWNNGGE